MSSITLSAVYTKNSGEPATGLTLSDIQLHLRSRARATGTVATIWNGVAPTEEIGGGIYTRTYSSADEETYEYYAWAYYGGAESLDGRYALQLAPSLSGVEVWGYGSRSLTQSAVSVQSALSGDTITILRGDTLSVSLTGLGSLAGYVSLDFMVKRSAADADNDAIIWIRKNASGTGDGVLRLNGAAAATPANGAIAIDDAAAGDITITLVAAETDDLVPLIGMYYEVQMITGTTVSTKVDGTANIVGDIVRAIT